MRDLNFAARTLPETGTEPVEGRVTSVRSRSEGGRGTLVALLLQIPARGATPAFATSVEVWVRPGHAPEPGWFIPVVVETDQKGQRYVRATGPATPEQMFPTPAVETATAVFRATTATTAADRPSARRDADLSPRALPLLPGDPSRIGEFTVTHRVGVGGMGIVYLGRSPGGRPAAVKVVRSEIAGDPEFRARFRREIDAARQVSGAFTAPVLDADPDAPRPWLATAYIDAPSLRARVLEAGPLAEDEVRTLGAGLAEALADLHRVGLVHRDLKPGNVLLAPDGPRLIDFGIIRSDALLELTESGAVLGSAGFMAPEQAEDAPTGPAADVFSLGAVLTYAALGRGPFGAGSAATLLLRTVHGTVDLDGLSDGLRAVVERCLARDPAERPTDRELTALLRA